MEVDVQLPLRQALTKAKSLTEAKDWSRAASAYEKAANLMSIWAEQAHGREAEERRKKMALQYRELAQKLRSGEISPDGPPPAPEVISEKGSAAPGGPRAGRSAPSCQI